MAKTIGVVILNYKSYKDTESLVKDIVAQKSAHKLIIQVVDNASPNESFEYLSEHLKGIPNLYLTANDKNNGYACGNNLGLRLLKKYSPDYALVINNDIRFDVSILDRLIEVCETIDNVGAVAPVQYYPNGEPDRMRLALATFWDDVTAYSYTFARLRSTQLSLRENTQYKGVEQVGIVPGSFTFIDYKLFESVGFFSEDTFLYCEERFLSRKLKEIGRLCYIVLDCGFVHHHSKTINSEFDFKRQFRMLHEGRIAYTRRFRRFPKLKVAVLNFMYHYQIARVSTIKAIKRAIKR